MWGGGRLLALGRNKNAAYLIGEIVAVQKLVGAVLREPLGNVVRFDDVQ